MPGTWARHTRARRGLPLKTNPLRRRPRCLSHAKPPLMQPWWPEGRWGLRCVHASHASIETPAVQCYGHFHPLHRPTVLNRAHFCRRIFAFVSEQHPLAASGPALILRPHPAIVARYCRSCLRYLPPVLTSAWPPRTRQLLYCTIAAQSIPDLAAASSPFIKSERTAH